MPFAPAGFPALGLSLLQPILADAGFAVTLHYATLQFVNAIGRGTYDAIAGAAAKDLAGDWVFAPALSSGAAAKAKSYMQSELLPLYGQEFIDQLHLARSHAAALLEDVVSALAAAQPHVVGFTSTFAQSVASLAAAQLLKERAPGTFIVLGGANCEGRMGAELVRQFPFVDAVVSGEGENAIVELVTKVLAGSRVDGIAGVVTREGGGDVPELVDLDLLPFPDYRDYYAGIAALDSPPARGPQLLVEASRGCWWGAKHHCTFCGLNGSTMAFRSKSPERFLRELDHLRATYGVTDVSAVDNILDYKYFRTVLPALAERGLGLNLFFEIKANVRKDQVALLRAAGVREVQPGIESFDDEILRSMRKGVSTLQNVQLLKWCKEYGIHPAWNILYGFPGEDPAAYARMSALVPLLTHLPPPQTVSPIRVDRFSPYFDDPHAFGIANLRPVPAYEGIYDLSPDAIAELAYYFDFDHADGRDPELYVQGVVDAVVTWKASYAASDLSSVSVKNAEELLLIDRRPSAARPFVVLSGMERTVYAECDSAQTVENLVAAVRRSEPAATFDDVATTCKQFTGMGFMIGDGRRYLSLAVSLAHGGSSPALRERIDAAAAAMRALS